MNFFKQLSEVSTPSLGIWQEIPHPSISRYLAAMGWDFVVLDMQHGAISSETAYQCVHIIRSAGKQPWIRVPIGVASDIQRALDIGAKAVVVPMVNTPQQAFAAAQAAKYPPLGERSVGGDFTVHQGENYPDCANRETLLLVQIEHIDAVQRVDEIMALPGVDGCFVGPTDLALSMGLPRKGFAADPSHSEAMKLTLEAACANKKYACCNSYSLPEAKNLFRTSLDFITYRSDVDLLMKAGRELLEELRECVTSSRTPPHTDGKPAPVKSTS